MDNSLKIFALTLYGEARGEIGKVGILSLQAVALVILNRWKDGQFGGTLEEVCLKPYQFSCWSLSDPNYSLLTDSHTLQDPTFDLCYQTAKSLIHASITASITQDLEIRAPWRTSKIMMEMTSGLSQSMTKAYTHDFTQGATHYHNQTVQPYWIKEMKLTLLLGNHMFYRQETHKASPKEAGL